MAETRLRYRHGLMLGTALVALTACSGPIDLDLRSYGNGFDTSDAALAASADRPSPDNRGVISYPTYQVAVARRGDTVAALADRVGISGDELARYYGLKTGDLLRPGEVLALPRRVAEPSAATGATIDGPLRPGSIDVSTIDAAIDRGASGSPAPAPTAAPAGAEPIRHKVARGETAYSVARLYNVSVRALSDWNGLGPDLTIREGQYLLIPVAAGKPPATATVEAQGSGSASPEPPSAAKPLPD
jgi:LysM repeat protein